MMLPMLSKLRKQIQLLAVTGLIALLGSLWLPQGAQASSYNNYTLDDFTVTPTDTTSGATDTLNVYFTTPYAMTAGDSLYFSAPVLYTYSGSSYRVKSKVNKKNISTFSKKKLF